MDVSGMTHFPTDGTFAVWEKSGVTLTRSSYWRGVVNYEKFLIRKVNGRKENIYAIFNNNFQIRKVNGREENIYVITIFRLLITIFRLLIVYQKIP